MSNIGIIDKLSQRQNRMKEKYFSKQAQSTKTSSVHHKEVYSE
jgi:hypothetical protein